MARFKNQFVSIILLFAIVTLSCVYIVLPEDLESFDQNGDGVAGWSGYVTNLSSSSGAGVLIELSIRNDNNAWSAMNALEGQPARLVSGGQEYECSDVFVSTGGHRVAPGFLMRGFTTGTAYEPETQMIQVGCKDAVVGDDATLNIDYEYVTGEYNYYEQDKNRQISQMVLNLDEISADLIYPIGQPPADVLSGRESEIVALNKVNLKLVDLQRAEDQLQLSWQTSNPGEYPAYVHIGNTPVIGNDGILYGFYETPDIVSVPITPAGGTAEWSTMVNIPASVNGLYIMLSVESGKARLFANYVLDITEE